MIENLIWARFFTVIDEAALQIQNIWNQKRAIVHEILDEKLKYREATPALDHDRTKIDLLLRNGKLGTHGGSGFDENLPLWSLSEDLTQNIEAFRKMLPPLEESNIRFRVRDKMKGLWINSSKENILRLKTRNSDYLHNLQKEGWILELGANDRNTQIQSWLPSYSKDNHELNLKFYISTPSQPGPDANRAIVAIGMDLIQESGITHCRWFEWGCGYGNLTAAVSTLLGDPTALIEESTVAIRLISENKSFFKAAQVVSNMAETFTDNSQVDLLIIESPKRGFPETTSRYFSKIKNIIIFNDDLRTLISDIENLKQHYHLKQWSIADIFPATPQIQVVSLWERK